MTLTNKTAKDTPCQGGCGKVRGILYSDSPTDWLCNDCRTKRKAGRSRKHQWDLYWSPEGRKIATVEAVTARQAIRMAPVPYRKYLGEIYAQATNPNAYTARVYMWSDGLLLGGSRNHVSYPFESEDDAHNWARQCIETNKGRPGYESADIRYEIIGVYDSNPIPATK